MYVEQKACRTCGEEWAASALDCTGECDECASETCGSCGQEMSRDAWLDHDCGLPLRRD